VPVTRLAREWRKKLEKTKRKEKTRLSNIQAEKVMKTHPHLYNL